MGKRDKRSLVALGNDFMLDPKVVEELIRTSDSYEQARRRMIKVVYDRF